MSVVVLGSANLDLVYGVERIPGPGETVLATGFAQHPGGKGNNQVTAVARAGAEVAFIAALGHDDAADTLIASLRASGVGELLRRVDAPTGTALITVDGSAENTIVVNSGANASLRELREEERRAIEDADYLLLQLETPIETVVEAARIARTAGTIVVLNAAPIRSLPAELLNNIDLLIVNEHEAGHLADQLGVGETVDDLVASDGALPALGPVAEARALAAGLLAQVPALIITLGSNGAVIAGPDAAASTVVEAIRVTAVDTTGAGDTFCGALVAALDARTSGDPASADTSLTHAALADATRFATAAAALSVQRTGAVPSIPLLKEIDDFRSRH